MTKTKKKTVKPKEQDIVVAKRRSAPMSIAGSQYSDEQRRQAAVSFGVHGVMSKVSAELNIPQETLCNWKATDWWDELSTEARNIKATEMRANYQKLVLAAQDKALELLPTMTNAKDAMLVSAVAYDKLRLADNIPAPTNAGGASALEALAKRFEQLARDNRVIAVQDKADDSDTDQ